ncbi:undecaprenyl-diphosphate phosphatase [Alicyclobacillus ferrooxydans]|uniref:Undecaprenyl-diphosphatase n=1 Tax=Alicyclobacillus ferrooxydans TaxID=471514 RepID=A0A0P9GP37_9BACL|nr:undecaprenyl-diphosphate phosphatase [Alicyclobacillus ferrooxydans]KPV42353.1 UDP-diphosphatase [Alicyclobacillus ferrooxydans]
MSWIQTIVYAIVQGITELFPISSVGHAVLLPYLAGWVSVSQNNQFLPFVVMLHLGTAIALLIYFWRDWVRLIGSLFQAGKAAEKRLLLLIIVATIPAAIVGKLFEHKFRALFPSALSAALFLIVNGFVLLLADRLRKRHRQTVRLSRMGYGQSFFIGLIQVLALIPGFSRSGITMTAALAVGLSYEDAAQFSFLLATPVILGAGILEVPKVIHSHATQVLHFGIIGGILTGILAFLSTFFLMRYFRGDITNALRPFAVYCIVVGVVVSLMVAAGLHF